VNGPPPKRAEPALRVVAERPLSAPAERAGAATRALPEVFRLDPEGAHGAPDVVAVEEPLEIRVEAGGARRTVAVTMRTPGEDEELAVGFLFGEGVVASGDDVVAVETAVGGDPNVLLVRLAAGLAPDFAPLERHFFTSSACGVCGKAGLEALAVRVPAPPPPGPLVPRALLAALPARLRAAQGTFDATGGLHAAALFDERGDLQAVREDVGRHNAVDKLVGWALAAGRLPLSRGVVLVSGRSSYEILQKCLVAGVPVVCSISAPSSLAVDLARRFGVTLVGFLRGDRANVYSRPDRVADR
jgi:FdhD protein